VRSEAIQQLVPRITFWYAGYVANVGCGRNLWPCLWASCDAVRVQHISNDQHERFGVWWVLSVGCDGAIVHWSWCCFGDIGRKRPKHADIAGYSNHAKRVGRASMVAGRLGMQSAKPRNMTTSYWYFLGGGASLYVIWIAVTAIGALVSSGVPNPQAIGLDFAIIAIFVATLPGMWRGTKDVLPWLLASGIVLIWGTLFPEYASWGLIGGDISCDGIGNCCDYPKTHFGYVRWNGDYCSNAVRRSLALTIIITLL